MRNKSKRIPVVFNQQVIAPASLVDLPFEKIQSIDYLTHYNPNGEIMQIIRLKMNKQYSVWHWLNQLTNAILLRYVSKKH